MKDWNIPEIVAAVIADDPDAAGIAESLAQSPAEIQNGEIWASVPYEADEFDNDPNATLPHEVVEIIVERNTSTAAAWRIYRGLTQSQAAEQAGITQAALSRIEKQGNCLQEKTREMLAAVYSCPPLHNWPSETAIMPSAER